MGGGGGGSVEVSISSAHYVVVGISNVIVSLRYHFVVFEGRGKYNSLRAATESTVVTALAFHQYQRASVFNSSPMLMWPCFDAICVFLVSLLCSKTVCVRVLRFSSLTTN